MKRKAIIETNIPGLATEIRLDILIETGEKTNEYEYRGFTKYYKFYDLKQAEKFAAKYCEIVKVN